MTESDWTSSTDPRAMLKFLTERGIAGDRKLRLFASACVRQDWDLLSDPLGRQAVELAERWADGLAEASEIEAVQSRLVRATEPLPAGNLRYTMCAASDTLDADAAE